MNRMYQSGAETAVPVVFPGNIVGCWRFLRVGSAVQARCLGKRTRKTLDMLTSIERVEDVDGAAEPTSPSDLPLTRYQAFYQLCYTRLEAYTRHHTAEVLRVVSFLIVGGLGAVVNLACVWALEHFTSIPGEACIVLATEVALLFNFLLNDRFTFHEMVDGRRPFWLRCVRFHGPAALGFVLTLVISDLAYRAGHLPLVVAQAIAILIVTVVNFVMHRLWTYRAAAQAPQKQLAS
jgi:putative flippase GtrA